MAEVQPRYDDGRQTTLLGVAGLVFEALPEGALWWADEGLLVVADLHLEKGSSFARRGQMLPPYDTAETLARLGSLVARLAPRRVVALGDSFHDDGGAERLAAIEALGVQPDAAGVRQGEVERLFHADTSTV